MVEGDRPQISKPRYGDYRVLHMEGHWRITGPGLRELDMARCSTEVDAHRLADLYQRIYDRGKCHVQREIRDALGIIDC